MMSHSEDTAKMSPARKKLYELLKAREKEARGGTGSGAIARVDRGAPLPLSFSQQRIWFVDYLEPGNLAYNVPGALRLAGELGVAALEASLNRIVERHEVLRTRIVAEGGQPRQVILKRLHVALPTIDLSGLDAPRRRRRLGRLATGQNLRPYRLDEAPLMRVELVRLSEREHVLLLNMHHSVADTWAINVFTQEMTALYEAYVEGRPEPLPPLPVQYADFAAWQRQQLAGDALTDQMSYWCEELGGELPVLELPTDRPRPNLQTLRGRRHYLSVPPKIASAIRALANRRETTPFVVSLAAFYLTLYRLSRQTDLLVGVPVAGRRRSELELLIGLFMNVVVLRSDLSGEPGGRQLIAATHERTMEALRHQDLPFERLVEALKLPRDLSRTPVYQVLFNLQNAAAESVRRAGVSMSVVDIDSGTARFDMETILWDQDGGYRGYLEYNTDLFDPTSIQRLAGSFERILRRLVEDPDTALPSLIGLSAAETHQLLVEHVDTRAAELAEESILPWIAAAAATHAEADAVVFEDTRLSYRELDRRANQLAHLLGRRGVGPESVVGVCMERCAQLVVSLLGILRAGAAYLPLDPEHPAERCRWLAADAGVRLVLHRAEAPALPETDAETVALDDAWGALAEEPAEAPAVAVHGAGAAYVIYTSGSTGTPKGVVSCHAGLANRLLWMQERFSLTPRDRVLQKTTFTFDVSVWEFFWPLMTGSTLVLARPGGHRDPSYLARTIAEREITTLHFVPSMLRVFLEAPETADCGCLKRAILSGEALPADLARRFAERLPAAELHNLYGPTEASIDATAWRYRPQPETRATVPIGRPIANLRTCLIDPGLRPLPLGVPGELLLGGPGLARGYLGRPGLTARCFVPDPLSQVPGERLYRTGDLVRHLAGGEMEFLNRLDHQVKVRGFRIELGEIEAHLREHPAVAEGVVVVESRAVGEGALSVRLMACVVAGPEAGEELETRLRAWLGERLPEYMVPASFVTLESLPQTASGKIDRGALSRLTAAKERRGEAVAPRGETERAVAKIWQEVLGVESVAVTDNFFDLGGDSLLLAQVHSRLRQAFETDLSMVDLFRFTTVKSLAERLRQGGGEEGDERHAAERARFRRRRLAGRGTAEGGTDVAVVAMSLYFPDSRTPDAFWQNLCDGVESVGFFTEEECLEAGADPDMLAKPDYVRAESVVEGVEMFDYSFFGLSPRDAELIDPQQRCMLELGWEVLERGGYRPETYDGSIGVFVGSAISSYLFNNLGYRAIDIFTDFNTRVQMLTGNDKDFCAQRLSYQLKLNGPSVNVQSACSSSLTAVHVASQSLLSGECDMALAGGVQIRVPLKVGYLYQPGGLPSPDGHCRSFDAKGMGTVHGNGAALVLLKRLEDALAAGDVVHAVIKGSAINNDAGAKVGFAAPSVDGITRVAAEALEVSGVDASTLGFVEAHGTATDLGDSIEVEALTRAFRRYTDQRQFCRLGAVKSNMGHMDAAAGMPSLFKAIMALKHGKVPPTLHFEEPNPKLALPTTPFRVNAELEDWPRQDEAPRRAAVNIFGIGGSNACMVLEEAPPLPPGDEAPPWQLLVLSARSVTALDEITTRLADVLRDGRAGGALPQDGGLELADVAFTLQVGRHPLPIRRALVCRDTADALDVLESLDPDRLMEDFYDGTSRTVTFLFPGERLDLGPWVGELCATEPTFRRLVEEGGERARADLDLDLTPQLEGGGDAASPAGGVARLVVQHALARLWTEWGVLPQAMLGHGVGELAAAAVAGHLPFERALALAAARGRVLGSGEVEPGPAAVALFAKALTGLDADADLPAPSIPVASGVTGEWLEAREAVTAEYWGRQLEAERSVETAVEKLFSVGEGVLLELGDGAAAAWIEEHPSYPPGAVKVASLGDDEAPAAAAGARAALLRALGRVWLSGIDVDWAGAHQHEARRRLVLPTYPFERQRCWVDSATGLAEPGGAKARERDVAGWFYAPAWRRSRVSRRRPAVREPCAWLALGAEQPLLAELCDALTRQGHTVVKVVAGEAFAEHDGGFALPPDQDESYARLFQELGAAERLPRHVLHGWGLAGEGEAEDERTSQSLLALGRNLGLLPGADTVTLHVLVSGVHEVTGGEPIWPQRAVARGICRVLQAELASLSCHRIDPGPDEGRAGARRLEALLRETTDPRDEEVACRGGDRWVLSYDPFVPPENAAAVLPPEPVVLLTGRPGAAAVAWAEELVRGVQARLVLLTEEDADDSVPTELVEARVFAVDVIDRERVAAVLERVVEELGRVDVALDTFALESRETLDAAGQRSALGRETRRFEVLTEALAEQDDVLATVLCDLGSIVPGPERLLPFSLHAWLQAFVSRHNRTGSFVWQWVAMDSWDPETRFSMTLAEGREVWRRLLAVDDREAVLVATANPEPRLLGVVEPEAVSVQRLYERQVAREYVAPRDETERFVAEIWSEVLGIAEIGVDDEFFELGGNSLLATQIVSRLRDLFQVDLPLRELLALRTVAGIAGELRQRQTGLAAEDDLESLLDELEAMPEDQARRIVGVESS